MVAAMALAGLVLAGLALSAAPLSAQQYDNQVTVNGTTITGTYTSGNGQPFFVGGYRFPPELRSNVVAISCPTGATSNLTGGPDGSPECLFSAAVSSAAVTITGRTAWPSTFMLTPFWSYDNRTYVLGTPLTATIPAVVTLPTVPATGSGASTAAMHEDDDNSMGWLWWVLGGVVLVGAGGMLWYRHRGHAGEDPAAGSNWSTPDAEPPSEPPDIGFAHDHDQVM